MCRDYIRGLIWVYRYYTETLPSWAYAYEWHYAPLMMDLSSYLNKLTQDKFDELYQFDLQNPALPFEQLLAILPPKLSFLLPEHYRKLMLDPNSPLVKAGYYPESFQIDYEGKTKDHEGIAILPFVDYSVVHKAYENAYRSDMMMYHRNQFRMQSIGREFPPEGNSQLGELGTQRDSNFPLGGSFQHKAFGNVYLFKYNNIGYLSTLRTKYGVIQKCKVSTTIM